MKIWTNGDIAEDGAASVDIADRGFLLGDGVFDTFRVTGGAPVRLDAHLARLRAAAAAFAIPVPFADAAIDAAVRELAVGNSVSDGVGRLTLSRGAGPRGLLPPDPAEPFAMMAVAPAPPQTAAPLRLHVSDVVRPSGALTSRYKTLSYLDNVEARRRAAAAGFDEALLLNERGEAACACAANIFWLKGGVLHTPALECGVLDGITRAAVIRAARAMDIPVNEGRFPLHALTNARAIFLTSSLLGVRPVDSVTCAFGAVECDVEDETLAALKTAEAQA